jgi:hypothetical protein
MRDQIRIIDPSISESFFERYRIFFDIGLHLLLLSAAISPFVMLYLKRMTPVSRRDFHWLLLALFALPVTATYAGQLFPEYAVPFIRGYIILSIIVLLISLAIVAWRLQKQSNGSYALNVLLTLLLLGLLIGILLPAVPSAREAARRMGCSNNLKQLALAIHMTQEAHKFRSEIPMNNAPEMDGGPDVSWRVKVLPYLEQTELKERYRSDQPWDSESNWEIAQKRLHIYTCPSGPLHMNPKGGRYTSYAMLRNTNLAPDNPRLIRPELNNPRSAYQIMLIESCGANLIWTEPRDVDLDNCDWTLQPPSEAVKKTPWNSRNVGASMHTGGIQSAFSDGSVRFLSQALDPEVLRQIILGEPVEGDLDF